MDTPRSSNPPSDSSMFQDMLLELMVQNETLGKISANQGLTLKKISELNDQSILSTNLLKDTIFEQLCRQTEVLEKISDLLSIPEKKSETESSTRSGPGAIVSALTGSTPKDVPARDVVNTREVTESETNTVLKTISAESGTTSMLIGVLIQAAQNTNSRIEQTNAQLAVMDRGLSTIIELIGSNRLQAAEDQKEFMNAIQGLVGTREKEKPEVQKKEGGGLGILGTILAIGGLVAGFVAGLISTFGKVFKSITVAIGSIFGRVLEFFTGIGKWLFKALRIDKLLESSGIKKVAEYISRSFGKVTEFFGGLWSKITGFLGEAWAVIKGVFRNAFTGITKFFSESKFISSIVDIAKGFFKPFQGLFSMLGSASESGGFLSKITGTLSKMWEGISSKFMKFLNIGKVLGRVAGVVTIVWDTFQSIMAGLDKFEKTGDLGAAFQTGITELIKRIIGAPLDLIKSAVSWVLGAFGFQEAEKFLDSFSITAVIEESIDRIVTAGKNLFASVFQFIQDFIEDFQKGMSESGFLGGVAKIFEKLGYYLIAKPLDWLVNKIAGILDGLGPWAKGIAEWLRNLDIAGAAGKGLTLTEPPTFKAENEGMSFGDAISKRTEAEKKSNEKKLKADKEEKKKDGEADITQPMNPIENFYNELMKAYRQNASGDMVSGAPTSIGAEMQAFERDTAEAEVEVQQSAGAAMTSAMTSKATNNNVNAPSVSYSVNNVPDRTNWMMTPLANWL